MDASRVLSAAVAALLVAALVAFGPPATAEELPQVDTALLVSADVSNSVDEHRYKLQMEGIAAALEDKSVQDAIMGGPNGSILFGMVTWADRPSFVLPWTRISSGQEALAVAARVRKLQLQSGEFTCMTRMMRSVNDKIVPQIPAKAVRTVVDVSGDGPDNCNADEPIDTVRDELVQTGVTINGLPINEGDPESSVSQSGSPITLEQWFRQHVMGGAGSFVLPANGYGDFGRAMRQKFVIEVSGRPAPEKFSAKPSIDKRLVEVQGLVQPLGAVPALEVSKLR
jgi:hypothetical protein